MLQCTRHCLISTLAVKRRSKSDPLLECAPGGFDDEVEAANLLTAYEARIIALEHLVGRQALELDPLKGRSEARTVEQKRA